jgi:hypothetical protein
LFAAVLGVLVVLAVPLSEFPEDLVRVLTAFAGLAGLLATLRIAVLRHDEALVDRDTALANRDAALANRDAAFANRDAAFANRDTALAKQETAAATYEATLRTAATGEFPTTPSRPIGGSPTAESA